MTKRILVAFLAATALYAIPTQKAQAMCCVTTYDYEDSKEQTKTVISTLSEKINAMQLAIIEAMRLGTGQLSGNSKEQIGAQANMANVNDDRRVVGNVEMARFNVIKSAASGASSCNTTTSGIATGGLNSNVISLSNSLTSDLVNWDTFDVMHQEHRTKGVGEPIDAAPHERACFLLFNEGVCGIRPIDKGRLMVAVRQKAWEPLLDGSLHSAPLCAQTREACIHDDPMEPCRDSTVPLESRT